MLTPQEINEKGFDKAVFNGYDMGDVDDFLEIVSNDYNALYKENAILKGKLKVLVEKVEEYRSTEDAMRMALLTAQRMGDDITSKASKQRDEMLQIAEDEVRAKYDEIAGRCADEEMRLTLATKETAKFIELSQAIMRKHAEFLDKLESARRVVKPPKGGASKASAPQSMSTTPAMRAPKPATKPAAPAKPIAPAKPAPQPEKPHSISETTQPIPDISKHDADIDDIALQIGSIVEEISDDEKSSGPPVDVAKPSEPMASPQSLFDTDHGSDIPYDAHEDLVSQDTSPRPKFDFDDLKFGANFDLED
ncbi:MAG: DivIVA domain-containing protein [Oscillospiraceae bacterium]|nr:DivIVA domain-containing protein [Oscillospiraceae bacterium]